MNSKITAYVEKVVDEIFSTMIFIKPINETPIIRKTDNINIPGKKDISGIIGLGGSLTASIMVHFEKESALKITSNMLGGVEYREIDGDVIDAVGEVTNMIAGGIKRELDSIGMDLELSLPIVVSGENFDTNCINKKDSVIMPFKIDGSNMFVEFNFKK
jgi:chemotaxis protein CheX